MDSSKTLGNSRRVRAGAALALGALFALGAAVGSIAAGPSRGPVPDDAFSSDGSINRELVPEFIPAVGTTSDTPIGWVAKADVMPENPLVLQEVVPVFGDDLVTVIGHMYPIIGFVPVGTDPKSVEPVSTPEAFVEPPATRADSDK